MSSESEKSSEQENQEDEGRGRRPPWMQSRFGMSPGGPPPIQAEQVPEWAKNSPEYWYARYVELEKAYRDLGMQTQQQNWQQNSRAMMWGDRAANNEGAVEELLSLGAIAVSIATLLFAFRGEGYHSLSTGVILGISFTGMVVAQRIHLPEMLGRIRSTLTPPYRE